MLFKLVSVVVLFVASTIKQNKLKICPSLTRVLLNSCQLRHTNPMHVLRHTPPLPIIIHHIITQNKNRL